MATERTSLAPSVRSTTGSGRRSRTRRTAVVRPSPQQQRDRNDVADHRWDGLGDSSRIHRSRWRIWSQRRSVRVDRQRSQSHGRRGDRGRRSPPETTTRTRAGYSPARATKVLTVSAMADYDGLPSARLSDTAEQLLSRSRTTPSSDFSNWGSARSRSEHRGAASSRRIRRAGTRGSTGRRWRRRTSRARSACSPETACSNWAGVSTMYSTLDGRRQPQLDRRLGRRYPGAAARGARPVAVQSETRRRRRSASESAAEGVVHLFVHGARRVPSPDPGPIRTGRLPPSRGSSETGHPAPERRCRTPTRPPAPTASA